MKLVQVNPSELSLKYKLFSVNRKPIPDHIKSIGNAMYSSIGKKDFDNPLFFIMANKNNKIIDGQHRAIAAAALIKERPNLIFKMNVLVMELADDKSELAAREINTKAKKWNTLDFYYSKACVHSGYYKMVKLFELLSDNDIFGRDFTTEKLRECSSKRRIPKKDGSECQNFRFGKFDAYKVICNYYGILKTYGEEGVKLENLRAIIYDIDSKRKINLDSNFKPNKSFNKDKEYEREEFENIIKEISGSDLGFYDTIIKRFDEIFNTEAEFIKKPEDVLINEVVADFNSIIKNIKRK